jgi:hypothetical protein
MTIGLLQVDTVDYDALLNPAIASSPDIQVQCAVVVAVVVCRL